MNFLVSLKKANSKLLRITNFVYNKFIYDSNHIFAIFYKTKKKKYDNT